MMLGSDGKVGKFPLRSWGHRRQHRHLARLPPEALMSGLWEAAVGNASRNQSAGWWIADLTGGRGTVGRDAAWGKMGHEPQLEEESTGSPYIEPFTVY